MIETKTSTLIIIAVIGDIEAAQKLHSELFLRFKITSVILSPNNYFEIEYKISPFNPIISLGGPDVNDVTNRLIHTLESILHDDENYQIRIGKRAIALWGKGSVEGTQNSVNRFKDDFLDNWLKNLR